MTSDKPLLTYKRRRFSLSSHLSDVKASASSFKPLKEVYSRRTTPKYEPNSKCKSLNENVKLAIVEGVAGLESTIATNLCGDSHNCNMKRSNLSHQPLLTSCPAEDKTLGQLNRSRTACTTDLTKNPNAPRESNQSASASNASSREVCARSPASSCLNHVELNESSKGTLNEKLQESRSSSTLDSALALLVEESYGKYRNLESNKRSDQRFGETKEDQNISLFVGQGVNAGGQASSSSPVSLFAQCPHNQDPSRQCTSQIAPAGGKVSLAKSGEPVHQKQQHGEALKCSSPCKNFLRLSLAVNPEVFVDSSRYFRSISFPGTFTSKDGAQIHNRGVPWNPLDETSLLSSRNQIVENVKIGSQFLKERQLSSLQNFWRYPFDWSEEELDYLWIGVRRYGVENWNSILRDPRFCFSESKTAADLAERWESEEKKLLNSRPVLSTPIMNNAFICARSDVSDVQRLATETRLSLGDVYCQKEDMPQRNMHPLANGSPSAGSSFHISLSNSSVYSSTGLRNQRPTQAQNSLHAWGHSSELMQTRDQKPSNEQLSTSNLPHWLKDLVLNMPPQPSEPALPQLCTDEPLIPPKDPQGRGILKRKSMASGSSARLPVSDVSIPLPADNNAGGDLCKRTCPIAPTELVRIDSDASSEETISDDQS